MKVGLHGFLLGIRCLVLLFQLTKEPTPTFFATYLSK